MKEFTGGPCFSFW